MELIRNVKQGDYGLEGEVYFKLFDKYIRFGLEHDADLNYARNCAVYLNSLNEVVVEKLCQASIHYCNDFLDAIGEDKQEFQSDKDVLKLIDPNVFIVPAPNQLAVPVIHLELNCEWEPEHGLEWIVRGDEVLYVGAFNDENPWRDFSVKESWNYA